MHHGTKWIPTSLPKPPWTFFWKVASWYVLAATPFAIYSLVLSFNFTSSYIDLFLQAPPEKKRRVSQKSTQLDADIVKLQLLMTQEDAAPISTPIPLTPQLQEAHEDTLKVLNKMSPPHLTEDGPLAIPVVTVETDNANLIFERPGCKECSKKEECCAHLVNGPPSLPLNEYTGPGAHSGLCLLCIRMECAMLVQMHKMCGSQPITALLPPFTNLVDCPGGYHKSAMGVTPDDQEVIKGGVHIMGVSATLAKAFNPLTGKWYIDQGSSVYRQNDSDGA